MSKFYSVLLGALCLSSVAFSQSKKVQEATSQALQPAGSTTFGIQAGVNLATVIAGNSNLNAGYKAGFNGGIAVEHYFSERWSMKGKVLYDQKGWNNGFITIYNSSSTVTTSTSYQVDYVTVPLLANWHFGRTRNWYLEFGPYVSFLTSAKTTTNSMDMKPYFNSVDGGLGLGIGIKFPISEKARFYIEYSGQAGIGSITKNGSNTAFGQNLNNSVGALNVGINF